MTDLELQQLFHSKYIYDNGQLISKHNCRPIRNKAGGYLKCEIIINGKTQHFRVHRVIYCMHYGVMPTIVDHINHDILDNRIENLRAVTYQQNSFNRRVQTNNKLGVKGVCLNTSNDKAKKPYAAFIKLDGIRKRIGSFATIEEAKQAYDAAAHGDRGDYHCS